MKSRKKITESTKIEKKKNREKYFRIEKNISESRKIFQYRERCLRIEKYFVTRIYKKYLELNVFTTFLHNNFIA